MKNRYYLFLVMMVAICCTSCNNEWEDEQFVQLASFKAVPNSDGVTSAYVRYKSGGKITYDLPVLLSGSTVNAYNRAVHIALDIDTLNVLNRERYGEKDRLYYQLLDKQYYTMPETVEMPKGESMSPLSINFNLGGTDGANPLDMSDKYILPLTIKDDASYDYQANPRKHYRKALLNIIPFNDYSGSYSGTNCKIFLVGQSDAFTLSQHKAYVHNENTVFFYMGLRNIDYLDRKDYKLFMEFTDEVYMPGKYKLKLWSDNKDENRFRLETEKDNEGNVRDKQSYYTVEEEYDSTKPYLKRIYITLYVDYYFDDYTLSPGNRLNYHVTGTMGMQRELNTLIPDEDQQIQWD